MQKHSKLILRTVAIPDPVRVREPFRVGHHSLLGATYGVTTPSLPWPEVWTVKQVGLNMIPEKGRGCPLS